MFRFILIFIIFLICTYVGYYYGETFRKRSQQLKELQKSLILMNSEVLYSNTPLAATFSKISTKVSNPLSSVYLQLAEKLNLGQVESVYKGFFDSYEENKDEFYLKEDDISVIRDFFNSLGESGVYGQEKIFNLALENIKSNSIEADKEAKSNTKMYRTLGLCTGAVLAIFLI